VLIGKHIHYKLATLTFHALSQSSHFAAFIHSPSTTCAMRTFEKSLTRTTSGRCFVAFALPIIWNGHSVPFLLSKSISTFCIVSETHLPPRPLRFYFHTQLAFMTRRFHHLSHSFPAPVLCDPFGGGGSISNPEYMVFQIRINHHCRLRQSMI